MPSSLLISGSLALKALQRHLASQDAAKTVVVEFDTQHDRRRFPQVAHWLSVADFTNEESGQKIEQHALDLLDFFLEDRTPSSEVPVGRAFRQACMKVQDKQIVVPYLFNLHLARAVFDRFEIDRILVAPGSGVNFSAWQQVAAERSLPCVFLPVEKLSGGLMRRLFKWWFRTRKKLAGKKAVSVSASPAFTVGGAADLLIASDRLQKLLAPDCHPSVAATPAFAEASPDDLAAKKAAYGRWWQTWQQDVFGPKAASVSPAIQNAKDVLLSLGSYYSDEVYPRQACRLETACQMIGAARPRLLLCDTQTGSPERMWSLAAAEFGIPVAAYTYDHLIDPKLSFKPDYLLSDSGRNTKAATDRGMDAARITETTSHRRPKNRQAETAKSSQEPPLVLFADSYYSGLNVLPDPQASCRYYDLLIGAARRLPHLRFKLKFHPLRGSKNARFSFTIMDDQELLVRTRYLRSLKPPANFSLIAPEENIHAHLAETAILLNSNSIVALEAFHLDVPVVFVRRPDPTKLIFPCIDQYDAALCALNLAELVDTIQRLIADPHLATEQAVKQKRYINEYYWRCDRPLAEAVSGILKRL